MSGREQRQNENIDKSKSKDFYRYRYNIGIFLFNDIALLQYIRIAIFTYIREYKHIKMLAQEYDEYFGETEKKYVDFAL